MDMMDVDVMPGGDAYVDVTAAFQDGAAEMGPGGMLFMDDFSLQDAMSAIEIGEPRLDNGITLGKEREPKFNALTPMLPQEVCWIIDRSFACEMEWHSGNTLSQTVFTLLYVHHLSDFEPDFISSSDIIFDEDPMRPLELITVVLRSVVFGLLKCCDLAWRELSKGGVHETEDWQGEKCDVSLLESVPVKHILSKLDLAETWLSASDKNTSVLWSPALSARIILRKTLLQLMNLDIYKNHSQFEALITLAREKLQIIRSHPSLEPPSNSPSFRVFDPLVGRRLNTFIPIRVLSIPSSNKTWDAIDGLLDGWQELSVLHNTTNISTWEIVGNLRLWLLDPPTRVPYMRACTQSAFYDGIFIMNRFTSTWLVDRFFFETIGISFEEFAHRVIQRWTGSRSPRPQLTSIERQIIKLLTPHIKALWVNAPRRRRYYMKSLFDWHVLYDLLFNLTSDLSKQTEPADDVVTLAPYAALHWRLSTLREVIYSGFQLELYTSDEKAFAYWYASQIIEIHASSIDRLLGVVSKESLAYEELVFQRELLTALQVMSIAMFAVSMKLMSSSWQRMRLNFFKRYKWAFRTDYDDTVTEVVGSPEFDKFMPACSEILKDDKFSPSESFVLARSILTAAFLRLIQSEGGWAGKWRKDRILFVQGLVDVCEKLYDLPTSMSDIATFDIGLLKWDPRVHPWFPCLSVDGKENRQNIHMKPLR